MSGPTSGLLELGDEVTFEARHFGIRWRLTARITQFEQSQLFVDEMQRGPFAFWRHEHVFGQCGSETIMIDAVDYKPPARGLGTLVDYLVLRRYMRKLLHRRGQYLKSVAEVTVSA